MILTEREKEMVLYQRQQNELLAKQKEAQKTCQHTFRYIGHSHNDSAYECSKCGIIRYE